MRIRFIIYLLFCALPICFGIHIDSEKSLKAEDYFKNGKYHKAKSYALQIIYDNPNSLEGSILMAKAYAREFKKDSSLFWLSKVDGLLEKGKNKKVRFEYFLWRGYNYEVNKDYDLALGNYFKALPLINHIKDPYYHDFLYQRIFLIYSENNYKSSAENWLGIYRRIKDSLKDDRYSNNFFNALGKHYFYNDQPQKSSKAFQRSIDLSIRLQDSNMLNNSYWHKAIIFAEHSKSQDSARFYYNQSKRYCGCPKNLLFQSTYKYNTAVTYVYENDMEEAFRWLHKTLLELPESRIVHIKNNVYRRLYQLHDESGKIDSSFFYLKLYKKYDDSLGIIQRDKALNEIQTKYEVEKKENENLKLKQNRNWLIGGLITAILLIGLSYLAYSNQKKKKLLVQKESQVKTERLDALLKEQELLSLDAMVAGQEKERQRIANDLHDNLGSILATIKLHFQNLKIRKERIKEQEDQLLQKTDDLIEEAYQKVRSLAHAKNVGLRAKEGLLPAIKNFASKVSLANKLVIEVEDHGMEERLENSLEITLFRIVQELVTNVVKHSKATESTVHITHHDRNINIMVEDNGEGFETTEISEDKGMGLYSIQKRVENLDGTINIDSILGKGTSVIIDIPLT